MKSKFATFLLKSIGIDTCTVEPIATPYQVKAVDIHCMSLYKLQYLLDNFELAKRDTYGKDIRDIFYKYLTASFLINDTDFCNMCWGMNDQEGTPMPMVLNKPFNDRGHDCKYTMFGAKATPDNLGTLIRDAHYYKVLADLTSKWKEICQDVYLDGMKEFKDNLHEFASCYSIFNSNFTTCYDCLVTYFTTNEEFLEWLNMRGRVDMCSDIRKVGIYFAKNKYGEETLYSLVCEYLKEKCD